MTHKSLELIFEETKKFVREDSFPLAIWDTSAIIDICASARKNRCGKKLIKDKDFLRKNYPDHFLMYFGGKFQSIIPSTVYGEIKSHYCVKRNSHTLEIDESVRCLLHKFHNDYLRLKEDNLQNVNLDIHIEEIKSTSNYKSNKRRMKKKKEGLSEADEIILKEAIYFSEHFGFQEHQIGPVIVFSSDEHILNGIRELKKKGYKNIESVSLRIGKNGR